MQKSDLDRFRLSKYNDTDDDYLKSTSFSKVNLDNFIDDDLDLNPLPIPKNEYQDIPNISNMKFENYSTSSNTFLAMNGGIKSEINQYTESQQAQLQQQFIIDAAKVLEDINDMTAFIEKTYATVKNNVRQMQEKIKELIDKLEDRVDKLRRLNENPESQDKQKVKTFKQIGFRLQKNNHELAFVKEQINIMKQSLTQVLNIKIIQPEELNVRLKKEENIIANMQVNVQIKKNKAIQRTQIDADCERYELNRKLNEYDYMYDQLNARIIALSSKSHNKTDFYTFAVDQTRKRLNLELIYTINYQAKALHLYENRLFIDYNYYKLSNEFTLMQTFKVEEVSSIVHLKSNYLVLGHREMTKCSFFKFNGKQYQYIKKSYILRSCPTYKFSAVEKLRANKFCPLENEIYCVCTELLYKAKVDYESGCISGRIRISRPKNKAKIIDYRILDPLVILIQYTDFVLTVHQETYQELGCYKDIVHPQQSLVVLYHKQNVIFEETKSTIMVTQNSDNLMVEDMRHNGKYGDIMNSQKLLVLGQVTVVGLENQEVYCMCLDQEKYGQLVLIKVNYKVIKNKDDDDN